MSSPENGVAALRVVVLVGSLACGCRSVSDSGFDIWTGGKCGRSVGLVEPPLLLDLQNFTSISDLRASPRMIGTCRDYEIFECDGYHLLFCSDTEDFYDYWDAAVLDDTEVQYYFAKLEEGHPFCILEVGIMPLDFKVGCNEVLSFNEPWSPLTSP